jgi:hypothetical protein
MRFIALALLLIIGGSGCAKTCSEIGCVPVISVLYSSPINGTYCLHVSTLGTTYGPIDCPSTDGPKTLESGIRCSAEGFSIQGPDLFRGSDPPSEIAIQIHDLSSGTQVLTTSQELTARVSGSLNAGCDMNCYRAEGSLVISQ